MRTYIILSLSILLATKHVMAQDTLINGVSFNIIEYYENGALKVLGQKDSTLNGQSIYFKHNGDTLAQGKFKNGYKVGIWTYYKRRKQKIYLDFGKMQSRKFFELVYKHKKLIIIDSWFQKSHCREEYRNGKFYKEYCF